MRATLSSKHTKYPFETATVKNYKMEVIGDPHALAKGYDKANIMTVVLKVAKSNYQSEEIQTIIKWSREPYISSNYYRDLAMHLDVKEDFKKTIVFTHARITVDIRDNTREDDLTIIVTAYQKEDKMSGVCFGQGLEETYEKAEKRVANPPRLNIYMPQAPVAGHAKQEKREYANDLGTCHIYVYNEKGQQSHYQTGFLHGGSAFTTDKTKLFKDLNVSSEDSRNSCKLRRGGKETVTTYLLGESVVRRNQVAVSPLENLGFGVEYDANTKTITIDKRNYRYFSTTQNGITLHVIKTTAWNIGFASLNEQSNLYNSSEYGINGGFFNMGTNTQVLHIAIKNGRTVIQSQQDRYGAQNSVGGKYGGTLVFSGSKVYHVEAVHYTEILDSNKPLIPESSFIWAQGGFSMCLDKTSDNAKNEWQTQNMTYSTSTYRTAMVTHPTSLETYLIVSESGCTAEVFRQAIRSYFGSSANQYIGIFLDGGGSTQLMCADQNGNIIKATSNNRKLIQIVKLESKGYSL